MKTEQKATSVLAKRIQELRKDHGWSREDLAQRIGTSWQVIGRYERGDVTPSIEVARKLAEAFNVTLDYLVVGYDMPEAFKDREMLTRWRSLEALPQADKERVLYLVDAIIRDVNAREAYKAN